MATQVRLGTQIVTVPPLVGAVGRPNAAYPLINQPAALRQVAEQFSLIAELDKVRLPGAAVATAQEQAMANAAARWQQDRNAAIAGFQVAAGIVGTDEARDTVILPRGTTWPALFTHGATARELDNLRDRPAGAQDYIHTGTFDRAAYSSAVTRGFAADRTTGARFAAASLPEFVQLLGFMEQDARIFDVRWMAYMLATAYWETAHTVIVGQRSNGRPIRQWRTMAPVQETGRGAGRPYHLPVKVEQVSPALARITEQDGERFEVTASGSRPITAGARMGSSASAIASRTYASAAGNALAYHGRGYVQLTWWANYAAAGVSIRRGLDLLYDPELALRPDIAYQLMAHSMMTGDGFANGRTLRQFIYGALCDYAGARALVNARDPQPSIVAAARIFEAALIEARR